MAESETWVVRSVFLAGVRQLTNTGSCNPAARKVPCAPIALPSRLAMMFSWARVKAVPRGSAFSSWRKTTASPLATGGGAGATGAGAGATGAGAGATGVGGGGEGEGGGGDEDGGGGDCVGGGGDSQLGLPSCTKREAR